MPCGSWQLSKGLKGWGALGKVRLGTESELAQQQPPRCGSRRGLQFAPLLHSCSLQLAAVAMPRPAFPAPLGACGCPALTVCWAPGMNSSSQFSHHFQVGGSRRTAFLAGMGEGNRSSADALDAAWERRFPELCPRTRLGDQKPPTYPWPRLVPKQRLPAFLHPSEEDPEPICWWPTGRPGHSPPPRPPGARRGRHSLKSQLPCPGQVAHVVGVLSCTSKVGCSILDQGTYLGCGFDPRSGHIQEATNQCSLSLSQINKYILR